MKFNYLQNFIGVSLTEEELNDISHPYTELCTHVTLKTVQIGGTFGTFLFGPILAAVRKPKLGLMNAMVKSGKVGVVLGLMSGPPMTFMRIKDVETLDPITDRCYRIRKNMNQLRVDRSYFLGGGVGTFTSVAIASSPVFGFLAGSSMGLISAGLYNHQLAPK
ncbi:uncharacterized protein LOC100213118 [Hydra vulgaris]|uniref:Uncharacterized protein LOC100213118 n=1 Tax=Hydra vulgaris TaxID=6087 RepID=A0ABM4CXC7_HYDVU